MDFYPGADAVPATGAFPNTESRMNKLVHIIIAIFLPPIAVYLRSGAGKDLLINILLCLLAYVPGILHALWIVTR